MSGGAEATDTLHSGGTKTPERLRRRVLGDLHDELLALPAAAERDQFVDLLTRLLDHHTRRAPHLDAARRR
ncbi:hypothetical protein ACFMQL_34435 [Nonomuraea fastidiosa]|uniref:hypothetical protein n=1 Tax=Nonomuraea TaxID=83681 RepID=UPI003252765C